MNLYDELVEYLIKLDDKKKRESNNEKIIRNKISFIDRYNFNRIIDNINKIVSKIESESGWEYNYNEFNLKSDFYFDKGKINYKINSIPISNEYIIDDLSEHEIKFIEKYFKQLKKLDKLLSLKEEYYKKYFNDNSNIILFDSYLSNKKKNDNKLLFLDYLRYESEQFFFRYKNNGINDLISILNMISDSEDVNDAYNKCIESNEFNINRKELLRMASPFNKRSSIIYDKYITPIYVDSNINHLSDSFMKDESDLIIYFKNKKG